MDYSAYSNELNQSRLTLLKAREDALQEVFTEACRRLHEVDKKPDYPHLIEKLIVQVLYFYVDSSNILISLTVY